MNTSYRGQLLCILLGMLPGVLHGQTILLNGVVVIQNSEYETGKKIYVSDASIRAPFAKAVTSDESGQFNLGFTGVATGAPVRLTISKPGLEVVNSKETEQVILGRVPTMNIVMADPEKLATAQVEYYIATRNITAGYERRMAALRSENMLLKDRLAELTKESGAQVTTMQAALDLLEKQRNAALAHAQELATQFAVVDLDQASQRYRSAFELFKRGQLDSSFALLGQEELQKEYADSREVKGRANASIRQVVDSYQLKADISKASMDYPQALDAFQHMRTIANEEPDAIDPVLQVEIRERIAGTFLFLGRYDEAMAALEEALLVGERLLPPGHTELGVVHEDMAIIFSQKGQYDEALKEARTGLAVMTLIPGQENEHVGSAHQTIASVLVQQAQYPAALVEYELARGILEKALRPGDPRLNDLYFSIGSLHGSMGQHDLSLAAANANLAFKVDRLGAEHPDVAGAYRDRSKALMEKGDYAAALTDLNECLRIQLATLGPAHPELAATYDNLGLMLKRTGDLDGAKASFERCVSIARGTLGADHPLVASALSNMSSIIRDQGDIAGSLEPLKQSLAIRIRTMGPATPMIMPNYVEMAVAYQGLGEADSAVFYARRARAVGAGGLGEAHPVVALIDANIASCMSDQGKLDSADVLMRSSIARAVAAIGATHPAAAGLYRQQATIEHRLERYDSAMVDFHRCIGALGVRPPDDPELAVVNASMALTMSKLGDRAGAIDLVQHALRVYDRKYGQAHPTTARFHANAAAIFEDAGRFADAQAHADSALVGHTAVFGADHKWCGSDHLLLGRIAYRNHDLKKARHELLSAERIYPRAEGYWFQYRIAMDEGQDEEALAKLIACARARGTEPATHAKDRAETLTALEALAAKLNRRDVLKEFNLE